MLKDYIQDTAIKTHVDAITQYNTEVQNVSKEGETWSVRTSTLRTLDKGKQSLDVTTSVRLYFTPK